MRYADDFYVVVSGQRTHAETLVAETAAVLAPLGLTLSPEKTRITHIDEGIEFLGWRLQRHRASNGRSYVYTYASKPSLAAVKAKVKAITRSGPHQTLGQLLHRLNPVLRGGRPTARRCSMTLDRCGSSTTATAGPRSPRHGRRAASSATPRRCSSVYKP